MPISIPGAAHMDMYGFSLLVASVAKCKFATVDYGMMLHLEIHGVLKRPAQHAGE